jgi:CheY-like chemotaxis protein
MSFHSILKDRFNVIAFEKGTEALQFIKENPGDAYAAFVDYCMPDMRGDEVCTAIRGLDSRISLIGFSGSDSAHFSEPIFALLHKKFFSVEKVEELAVKAVAYAEELRRTGH